MAAARWPVLPVSGVLPDDGLVDEVAVARVVAGEYPAPRLTSAECAEAARRLARVWHVSQATARTWITGATTEEAA